MRDFLAMLKFAEFVDVPPETRLVERGTATSSLYIIGDGEVEVKIHGQENIRLSTGDVFGEQSILQETNANADAVTGMACRLAKFTREGTQVLIASDKAIAKIFQTIVNTRSRR